MPELMMSLMIWIATVTALPVPNAVPEIERLDGRQMWDMLHTDIPYESRGSSDVIAIYNLEKRIMHLRHDWAPKGHKNLSVLVHELVHHMQSEAGKKFACRGEMEREAYEVQIAYLDKYGLKIEELFQINAMFLMAVTSCGMF